MNVLTIFEQRIGAIFEEGAPGEPRPFSFKRLARRMVREMEDETFVIDGVDTAPALYTVLVAQADDFAMRKLYISITDEISQLIEAQAKKRGYTFVGRPLVRFMVDPALRRGRFSVFAENIDPRTLARLRDEENAYLGVTPTHDVYPEQFSDDSVADVDFQDDLIHSDGLMDAPDDNIAQLEAEAEAQAEASLWDVSTEDEVHEEEVAAPEPDMELDAGIDTGLDTSLDTGLDASFDEGLDTGLSADVDADGSTDFVPDQDADESMGEEEEDGFTYLPDEAVASCTLTNPDTGETYHITGEHVFIGRGRSEGSVVLRDPNASRRHAELVWDQGGWFVHDLGSTNGTLVNDQECNTERLVDGDMLTIGVTNLVFRAG